ncbi:MAG: hypothetical protein R3F59_23910 [Myxococcota bacterium]
MLWWFVLACAPDPEVPAPGAGTLVPGTPSYGSTTPVPVPGEEVQEVFEQRDGGLADVLFVVDDGPGRDEAQARLLDALPVLVDGLLGAADFHLGVVSTDLDTEGGKLRAVDGRRWVDPWDPAPSTTLGQLITMGAPRAGAEQGLGAVSTALEVERAGANDGFLRDGSQLGVVVLSAGDDATPSFLVRRASLADWFGGLVGGGAHALRHRAARVGAAVRRGAGGRAGCCGWRRPTTSTPAAVAVDAAALQREFVLQFTPVPDSLAVEVSDAGGTEIVSAGRLRLRGGAQQRPLRRLRAARRRDDRRHLRAGRVSRQNQRWAYLSATASTSPASSPVAARAPMRGRPAGFGQPWSGRRSRSEAGRSAVRRASWCTAPSAASATFVPRNRTSPSQPLAIRWAPHSRPSLRNSGWRVTRQAAHLEPIALAAVWLLGAGCTSAPTVNATPVAATISVRWTATGERHTHSAAPAWRWQRGQRQVRRQRHRRVGEQERPAPQPGHERLAHGRVRQREVREQEGSGQQGDRGDGQARHRTPPGVRAGGTSRARVDTRWEHGTR